MFLYLLCWEQPFDVPLDERKVEFPIPGLKAVRSVRAGQAAVISEELNCISCNLITDIGCQGEINENIFMIMTICYTGHYSLISGRIPF